jgi:hypothetical protein
MGLQLPKWLIKLSGDLYIHKYLFWLVYKPHHYALTGENTREILAAVKPGDILLRRYDGYVNSRLTPGFWGHAALCVSDTEVIHALGAGVVREDLITFCRTDSVSVLRVKDADEEMIQRAIACAKEHEKARTAYDYRFRDDKNKAVYCTELVNVCYGGLFDDDFEMIAGNCILAPNGIRISGRVEPVIEFKYDPNGLSVKDRERVPCRGAKQTCEETLARRAKEVEGLPEFMRRTSRPKSAQRSV